MVIMLDIKKELEIKAQRAEGYDRNSRDANLITRWADLYCKAVDENDGYHKDIYISALMLKFWDCVGRIHSAVKQCGYEYDDCVSVLYKCINVACTYRTWQKEGSKTTAKACIYQTIATRGAPEIVYEYNRDNKKANVNTTSLDQSMSNSEDGTDNLLNTVELAALDYEDSYGNSTTESLIQYYVNKNKLVEAMILDTIAYNDCEREVKLKRTVIDDSGKECKYSVSTYEFWPYKAVRVLSSLPNNYVQYFKNKYSANITEVEAAYDSLTKAPNTKLYKYLSRTLQLAKNDCLAGQI